MCRNTREGFQVLALVYRDKSAYHHHLLIAVWFLPFVSPFFLCLFRLFSLFVSQMGSLVFAETWFISCFTLCVTHVVLRDSSLLFHFFLESPLFQQTLHTSNRLTVSYTVQLSAAAGACCMIRVDTPINSDRTPSSFTSSFNVCQNPVYRRRTPSTPVVCV